MLIEKNKGQGHVAGPLDILCILKLRGNGTFYVTFFVEHSSPGSVSAVKGDGAVRLKGMLQHTEGAPTLKEARRDLKILRKTITVSKDNVIGDIAIEVENPINFWLLKNWKNGKITLKEAIMQRI